MEDLNPKRHISDDELPLDFDLEDILAEFGEEPAAEPAKKPNSISDKSTRIIMEALDTDQSGQIDIIGQMVSSAVAEIVAQSRPEPAPVPEPVPAPVPEPEPEPDPDALSEAQEAMLAELMDREMPQEADSSLVSEHEVTDSTPEAEYAAAGDYAGQYGENVEAAYQENKTGKEKSRRMSPLVALMALLAMYRGKREKAEHRQPTVDADDEAVPELEPAKATKLYASQMSSLKLRSRIAAVISLVMVYLSFAYSSILPLFGALGTSMRAMALVLIILELSVMIVGLDVFTCGITSIVRRKMGAESLVSVSCVFSLLDAAILAGMNTARFGLPFCAVSAVSMTCALWGSYCTCKGMRSGFRVLASSKNLYTVSGEAGVTGKKTVALLKSRRSASGFITRSEEADYGEYVFGVVTPFLLIAIPVLAFVSSVCRGQANAFFHCISVMSAVSATFSCLICFALPFSVAAVRLSRSGAAIAGWSGISDIGRSDHVVITDSDVFPQGTVELGGIRILEGAFTDKVISATGSMIAASGSGLAPAFAELIRRNGYTISHVENFEPHDGGGMTAMVNGESVCVGNTGFMNLMGIRVPQKLATKNSLYTAINGALVGIFTVNYKPVGSVQDALAMLLHSKLEPIFAIRDFNITPMMIKQKFRMPTDSFAFPAYAERFRVSGAQPGESSRVAAVLSREGMGPLVDAAEKGRRLYSGVRAGTIFSAIGSVFGVFMMFILCWAKAFDSASVSNVITFMLLWTIPNLVVGWGLQR